jgi:hypothetical protein
MWNIIAVILAVGLAAVGIAQVFDAYKSGGEKMAQQALQSDLINTITVITHSFTNNHNFAGFDNNVAKAIGAVPKNWTGGSGTNPYTTPQAMRVTFAATNAAVGNLPAGQAYTITFTNVTPESCQVIAGLNIPQLVRVRIGTQDHNNPAYFGTANPNWPIPPSMVATQCAALTLSQDIVLTLT